MISHLKLLYNYAAIYVSYVDDITISYVAGTYVKRIVLQQIIGTVHTQKCICCIIFYMCVLHFTHVCCTTDTIDYVTGI